MLTLAQLCSAQTTNIQTYDAWTIQLLKVIFVWKCFAYHIGKCALNTLYHQNQFGYQIKCLYLKNTLYIMDDIILFKVVYKKWVYGSTKYKSINKYVWPHNAEYYFNSGNQFVSISQNSMISEESISYLYVFSATISCMTYSSMHHFLIRK